jgi:nitric oxide synthase oxygenase subunit
VVLPRCLPYQSLDARRLEGALRPLLRGDVKARAETVPELRVLGISGAEFTAFPYLAAWAENPQAGAVGVRMRQVLAEVTTYGTYRHTPEELAFAARVAWRSAGPVRPAAAGRPGFGITARLVRAAQGRGRGPAAPPGPVLVP